MSGWCVYLLKSSSHNRTYVGSCNDINRRLDQHNQILSGGAKFTRGSKWDLVYCLDGFSGRSDAFMFEAEVKGRSGLENRLKYMQERRESKI